MEYNNIKELMGKYWAGETDLQEESTLKKYFTGADVHPTLEQYRALFIYFEKSREDKSLDSIDSAVLDRIQGKAAPKEAKVRSLSRVLRVAAAIIALVGAVTFIWNINTTGLSKPPVAEIEDPKEALLEVKAALALVSSKLDSGKRQAIKGIAKTKTISILK